LAKDSFEGAFIAKAYAGIGALFNPPPLRAGRRQGLAPALADRS
jgi:hypothetical protein